MPISATGRPEHGFTLIELLVSLVIIAVLLGAVALAFPDTGARRSELAAERLEAWMRLACERAELTGRDTGIAVASQSLAFGAMQAGRWQRFADSPAEALRSRTLDTAVRLELRVADRLLALPDDLPTQPQLACLANGEQTPFELRLRGPGESMWILHGDAEGGLRRERDDAQR